MRLYLRPTWISPGRVDDPVWPCTGRGLPGRRVTTAPVRSYRTLSPLPVRGSRVAAPSAVCFCGTFLRVSPSGSYPPSCPAVSGLSSRDFSPPQPSDPPPEWYPTPHDPRKLRGVSRRAGRATRLFVALPQRAGRRWPCCLPQPHRRDHPRPAFAGGVVPATRRGNLGTHPGDAVRIPSAYRTRS